MTLVLFISSATRGPYIPESITFIGYDKVGHFCLFGLLAVAWLRALSPPCRNWHAPVATAIAAFTGLADEGIQYFNPARHYDYADLTMDVLGAIIAILVYQKMHRLRALLEKTTFPQKLERHPTL